MPVLTVYPQGSIAGKPAREEAGGGRRGICRGWTRQTARRNLAFLYSVVPGLLTGVGIAVTLTVRDIPETAEEWTALRDKWLLRVRRVPGYRRVHWVTEWQARGAPHLHGVVYVDLAEADSTAEGVGSRLLDHWVSLAERYGARLHAQHAHPVWDARGWARYCAKHAARGAGHYQRQEVPAGWGSPGRMWGYRGEWPRTSARCDVDDWSYYRVRRWVKRWRIAEARAAGDWRGVKHGRRLFQAPTVGQSITAGWSEWVPYECVVSWLVWLWCEGGELSGFPLDR